MYYGYKIETTKYGWVPAYTDEFNVPSDAWPLSMLTCHSVTQATRDAGCAIIARPIVNSIGAVRTVSGDISINDISLPSIGTILPGNIQWGEPVDPSSLPSNAVIATVQIGVLPAVYVLIIVVALCIAFTAGAYLIFADVVTDFFAEMEYYKTQEHYYDLVAQFQGVVSEEYTDCNSDGVNDILTRTWGNGSVISFALNQDGIDCLGGVSYLVIQEGAELPEPPDEYSPDIDWGFWLIVGLVGVGAIVIIPRLLPRR